MKVLLDTSVLVAALVKGHPHHTQSFVVLERVLSGKDEGYASAHSLAEMYAVLTKLPAPFRHTPEQALLSIEENVVKHFTIAGLTGSDYTTLIHEAALAGIQGGTIYDAILLKCASKTGVEKIWSLNLRHFQSIAPKDIAPRIFGP